MRCLILDDDFKRTPQNIASYTENDVYLKYNWDFVRNYDEFVAYITKNGIPDVISFDHDLGSEHYDAQTNIRYGNFKEKTGWHCANWMLNYCLDNKLELPKEIYIHSMNIVGALNIKSLFVTYNKVYPTDTDFYINDVFYKDGFFEYSYSKFGSIWDCND
jgi:hypothetical protein